MKNTITKRDVLNVLQMYENQQFNHDKMTETLHLAMMILETYESDKPINEKKIKKIVEEWFEE